MRSMAASRRLFCGARGEISDAVCLCFITLPSRPNFFRERKIANGICVTHRNTMDDQINSVANAIGLKKVPATLLGFSGKGGEMKNIIEVMMCVAFVVRGQEHSMESHAGHATAEHEMRGSYGPYSMTREA